MSRKMVSGFALTILLVAISTLAFNIQPIESNPGTITVPNDYPTIQEAINAASEGDIINVKPGTYYENVVLNKTLSLVGENPETTIIDGEVDTCVRVTANSTNITGFTMQSSMATWWVAGISFDSSHNNVSNNIIKNTTEGIILGQGRKCRNNTITNNTLIGNWFGIRGFFGASDNLIVGNNISRSTEYGMDLLSNNTISGNTIFFTSEGWIGYGDGISIRGVNNIVSDNKIYNNNGTAISIITDIKGSNFIIGNFIASNRRGISLRYGTTISENTVGFNDVGLYIWGDHGNNTIYHNNFIKNTQQVESDSTNEWDYDDEGNYWSDYEDRYPEAQKLEPLPIWDTPYVINENNQDNYPLIEPLEMRWVFELYGIVVYTKSSVTNPNFDEELGQISFNVTTDITDSCRVYIPKWVLDGAFNFLIDDVPTGYTIAWPPNTTKYTSATAKALITSK